MSDGKIVTPAQAQHAEAMRKHSNGAINLAGPPPPKPVPKSNPSLDDLYWWCVYEELPPVLLDILDRPLDPVNGNDAAHREEAQRVNAAEKLESRRLNGIRQEDNRRAAGRDHLLQYYPQQVEITDAKAAKLSALAERRAETEASIETGQKRGYGNSR